MGFNGIEPGLNHDLMGFNGIYPLVNKHSYSIENGPVEIVSFPSYKMVDLSIVMWQFTRG